MLFVNYCVMLYGMFVIVVVSVCFTWTCSCVLFVVYCVMLCVLCVLCVVLLIDLSVCFVCGLLRCCLVCDMIVCLMCACVSCEIDRVMLCGEFILGCCVCVLFTLMRLCVLFVLFV